MSHERAEAWNATWSFIAQMVAPTKIGAALRPIGGLAACSLHTERHR